MRYLDILTDPIVSGPHRRVQSLAEAMQLARHSPTLVLPRGSDPASPFCRELEMAGIPFFVNQHLAQIRKPRWNSIVHNLRWGVSTILLWRRAIANQTDAFSPHFFVINGLLNSLIASHPQLRSIPGLVVINDTIVPKRLFKFLHASLGGRLEFIFQAPSIKAHYFGAGDYLWSHEDIMPPGVDLLLFFPTGAEKRSTPQEKGCLNLGSLCNISPRKRIEDGIEVASKIASSAPTIRVRFRVAGKFLTTQAAYTKKLKALAEQVPSNCVIEFVGFLDRKKASAFLRSLDFLLLPSESESFPQVVVQAQAVGTLVSAYRIPGVIDQVADKETGFLSELGDTEGMAVSILESLEHTDHSQKIRLSASKNVESLFSLEQNAAKLCAIAERLLADQDLADAGA